MSSLPATDFKKQTIALWQSRARRVLQEEDVRLITENVTGFMGVLQEWKANAEKTHAAPSTN